MTNLTKTYYRSILGYNSTVHVRQCGIDIYYFNSDRYIHADRIIGERTMQEHIDCVKYEK